MVCEKCGDDVECLYASKIAQENGKLKACMCEACMIKNDLWCKWHQKPAIFSWDGSAKFGFCPDCISENSASIGSGSLSCLQELITGLSEKYKKPPELIARQIVYYVASHQHKDTPGVIKRKLAKEGLKALFPPGNVPKWIGD